MNGTAQRFLRRSFVSELAASIALQIVNQAVSLIFVTIVFALMYRILPSVRVGWQDVSHGAIATGFLFTIGKVAIGMYLGKRASPRGLEPRGQSWCSWVWVFYSSQIFLLGAEFTWLYAHHHGSHAATNAERAAAPGDHSKCADPPARRG